jgi:hypothetical protein
MAIRKMAFSLFVVCAPFMLLCENASSQQIPYVSPGIGIAWDFHGHLVISPKISVGINNNGTFYNLTFGIASSIDASLYPHYFIECQAGVLSEPLGFRKAQLFYGGGIGLTIPSSGQGKKPSMRVSLFTGFMFFLNVNILFTDTVRTDIGGQVVLPIPLKKVEKGSIGG